MFVGCLVIVLSFGSGPMTQQAIKSCAVHCAFDFSQRLHPDCKTYASHVLRVIRLVAA